MYRLAYDEPNQQYYVLKRASGFWYQVGNYYQYKGNAIKHLNKLKEQ